MSIPKRPAEARAVDGFTAKSGAAAKGKPPTARATLLRERARVAKALHNSVCQDLTGISLMASAAARQYHVACPEAEKTLKEIARLLQGAGDGLQEFIRTLRPRR